MPPASVPPLSAATNTTFGSSGSVTPKFSASLPPELVNVIVYVSTSPGSASPLPDASVTDFAIATLGTVGITLQFGGEGDTLQSGGVPPVSCARLPIAVTPGGIGASTCTVTESTRLPPAGTVSPLQVTIPPASVPPLSADTNATFGSSGSVTP